MITTEKTKFDALGQILVPKKNLRIDRVKNTLTTTPKDSQENAKILEHLKNKQKEVLVMMESRMKILKWCSLVIEPILAKLFKVRTEFSTDPDWMILATIIPLFKNSSNIGMFPITRKLVFRQRSIKY